MVLNLYEHCVPLYKLDFGDLINEITEPCTVLQVCAGPALVCCQICGCRTNKVENLVTVLPSHHIEAKSLDQTHLGTTEDVIVH